MRILQQRREFLARQFAVPQDPGEETGPDYLGPMHWDRCDSAVGVAQAMMAAFDPADNEARLLQSVDNLAARKARQAAHAGTVMR